MDSYRFFPTLSFSRKLSKIRKKDHPGYLRIRKVISRLLENPSDADGVMHGIHHGRYKKYVGRRDYRIIYVWCELCRKQRYKLADACHNCEHLADRTVVFFDIYHKNELAVLKHRPSS